ncbi:MAG: serine hydrolase [Nitrospinota bacterium]|jgi:CubicO group peptidase (beta-lactamase class C family)|nr:serine hydrolase [Nitrospinota bacterium]|tara:strand:- start:136 stop:1320 length:1185 start_codon:yes stop_codon:yes gene_type:complete
MKINVQKLAACCSILFSGPLSAQNDGTAPEVTDLNAQDVSMQWEKNIPYLEEAYISARPRGMDDDIPVGVLGLNGGDKEMILAFAREVAGNTDPKRKDKTDSLLISHKGKLIFESYYRRGRQNLPHFQMSITKSYTAFALGRAMQLGYLTMDDLNKPVVGFLKEVDQSKLVEGADKVTLAEALNMHSGVKLTREKIMKYKGNPELLEGQKQIQAYFEDSNPIPPAPRKFGYKAADPAMIMQVLEVLVPGSAEDFIRKELMGRMGITEYAWQDDTSGLPKSAAGSSFRSRDMLKFGMLIRDKGKWKGEQLIPATFMKRAVSPISLGWGTNYYGYFCWHRTLRHNGKEYPSIELRGALGQFVFIFPNQDLIVVATAHGVMTMLREIPERIIPAFTE